MVAPRNKRNLRHWHEKEHPLGPMETCWHCGRQKAKCRSKLFRYTDRDQALLEAKQMNEAENYAKPRTAYWCPWCDMYHHTTKLRQQRSRVLKQQRKWMFEKELERRAASQIDQGSTS